MAKVFGKMRDDNRARLDEGFSLAELLVSLLILVPLLGAAVSLFSVAARQHSAEQSSSEATQEARAGMDMMIQEIAQAGSHMARTDVSATTSVAISPSTDAQAITVNSSTGFNVGDYVDVDVGGGEEEVQLTAVGTGSISGIFRAAHLSGVPIRLFALPYQTGIIPPAGLGANSSAAVTTLKFFGDLNGDGTMCYVVYQYNSANAQITRSMTPITQTAMNSALPLIQNIKANSAQFTLYTDNMGVIASVNVALTVQNTVKSGAKFQETALSSRIVIPSAAAASNLLNEIQQYGGVNRLPPTPAIIVTWASQ
jgi:Tfp pilus assembly protein PilW